MTEVSLTQILQMRDERVQIQRQLLSEYHCPVVCFTMNIAGPIKYTPLIERSFTDGLSALDTVLPADAIRCKRVMTEVTGCQALYAVDMPAAEIKARCLSIEETGGLGRLFDMDVLDTDGNKLERAEQRGCIVCGAAGRACAAGRRHSVTELQECTRRIMYDHFAAADRDRIAAVAVDSLVREVKTTPKPGLVDQRNNGSHTDMTLKTFLTSAKALQPYFRDCVDIGRTTASQSPEHCFSLLRQAGLKAESVMFAATNGVNTHKGAIYTLGVLCGSIGRLWTPECPVADLPTLLNTCAELVARSVTQDFSENTLATAGMRAYRKEGIAGIRGELAAGLPSVSQVALPAYRNALARSIEPDHAGAITLLHLIATVQDTTLYHRGGKDGLRYASEAARSLLKETPYPSTQQIEALDDAFIARRLSPGGSADLLAVTYFLHTLL